MTTDRLSPAGPADFERGGRAREMVRVLAIVVTLPSVAESKRRVLPMSGHLRALLPRLNELPALALEAYTAPPVGNTTIRDRLDLCPSISITGGTSATLWLRRPGEICRAIEESLAEAGTLRGLVLTSARERPRLVPIEKIQQVRAFARGLTPERFA